MKVDIEEKVRQTLESPFEIEDVETVPDASDPRLCFENKGLRFEATVVYLEIRETALILRRNNNVMLEKIRMSYFYVVIDIVKDLGGTVRRAHDDGVYIFFQGVTQDSLNRAVKAAMKIKYMLTNEFSRVKKMLEIYDALDFAIGVDDGKVLCTKVGNEETKHGELIWSGDALNIATGIAKRLLVPEHIGVSELVHFNLKDSIKFSKSKKGKQEIWRSNSFEYNNETQKYFHTSFFWTVS
ncbi:MAG: hypothetical protein GQ569_14915 [Methylococcaceae bacterium]|nr:hypothetical protein [Methylococcaceae bacterium]